jgi:protein-serine/threonine kinase
MVLVREDLGRSDTRGSQDADSPVPVRTWKGKASLPEDEELMPDVVTFKGSVNPFEEGGPSCFSGASHPREPVDTDLMTKKIRGWMLNEKHVYEESFSRRSFNPGSA